MMTILPHLRARILLLLSCSIVLTLPAAYAQVPRDGSASRFLPVKDFDELAKRRDEIRAVAAARGMSEQT